MRLICTGAAATRLDVNTPVAATGRVVGGGHDRQIGRARRLDAASARPTPALEPALGRGHTHDLALPSWHQPGERERGGLGQAEHEVGVLDRLARRALHQVVERAEASTVFVRSS